MTDLTFTINIRSKAQYPIQPKRLRAAITQVLKTRLTTSADVSVIIVGDRKMQVLNKTYRQKDYTTDVLSFPQHDPSQAMHPFVSPPDGTLYLGDIVVSFPEAVREAVEEHMLVDDKIEQLVLHGLDHLMGIHHD